MKATKNDLSFNKAELDYQAMLLTSRIAVRNCLIRIDKFTAELHEVNFPSMSYLVAEQLTSVANELVVATETMYTLEEGLTREELVVVNEPLVIEADMAKTEAEQGGAE